MTFIFLGGLFIKAMIESQRRTLKDWCSLKAWGPAWPHLLRLEWSENHAANFVQRDRLEWTELSCASVFYQHATQRHKKKLNSSWEKNLYHSFNFVINPRSSPSLLILILPVAAPCDHIGPLCSLEHSEKSLMDLEVDSKAIHLWSSQDLAKRGRSQLRLLPGECEPVQLHGAHVFSRACMRL